MLRALVLRRLRPALLTLVLTLTTLVGVTVASAPPAQADACYTWTRTLSQGATGADVTQLQIRVAGWAGSGVAFTVDGSFGPATRQAVLNFQNAHGLGADGVAGSGTYNQIYTLQDDDCSPAHFAWSEVDGGCGAGGYSGGSVSAATVQNNLLQAMWRAEALRQRLGNQPLTVTSGFRSVSCDKAVGGSGTGYHTYGMAIDLVGPGGSPSLCAIAQQARSTAFNGILGPGYPGHYDHAHVDIRSSRFWDASDCGVTS